MAVKNNVKRAYELMGMRVHLQVSHILTNMVGAATDVRTRRAELINQGLKSQGWHFTERAPGEQPPAVAGPPADPRRTTRRRSRRSWCWRCCRRARYVRPITVAVMLPVALQPVDHLALLIEHLGRLVGDRAAASPRHPGTPGWRERARPAA